MARMVTQQYANRPRDVMTHQPETLEASQSTDTVSDGDSFIGKCNTTCQNETLSPFRSSLKSSLSSY